MARNTGRSAAYFERNHGKQCGEDVGCCNVGTKNVTCLFEGANSDDPPVVHLIPVTVSTKANARPTSDNIAANGKASSLPKRKDLLGIETLPVDVITHLLDRSDHYVKQLQSTDPYQKQKLLEGRTIANLFFENSTRTRISFELAERRLGGDVVSFSSAGSSMTKGESILDTIRVLESMKVDAFIVRHSSSGVPQFIASHLPAHVHVVNAGDGAHEHPTQALLDAAELRVALGDLKGKRIAVVGDIAHSRVARSNIWLLKKLGAIVSLVGPTTLIPRNSEEAFDVTVSDDLDNALATNDGVIVLRIQLERQSRGYFPTIEEYQTRFGITKQRLSAHSCIVLHPGPVNLGVELDSATAYGERSLVLKQVKRGVAVRMAVLEWIFS
jgi:aspartate carbamoyltransferase catalytic subunit